MVSRCFGDGLTSRIRYGRMFCASLVFADFGFGFLAGVSDPPATALCCTHATKSCVKGMGGPFRSFP